MLRFFLRKIQAELQGRLPPLEWNRRYLPHHFTTMDDRAHSSADTASTLPAFHHWLAEQLRAFHARRGSRLALVAPRESAKSTWVTLAYVLRSAIEKRERYILLFSDSEDQAEKFLAAVKAEVEGNARLIADYPDACGKGTIWRTDRIRLKNGVLIESLGRGSKVRGRKDRQHRPTLIVLDDCQSNRDIESAAERRRTLDWFEQEVLPAGSPRTNVISVGSALHREAIAVRAQAMPGWLGRTFPALLSWPDRMDLWQTWERLATNLADPERVKTAASFHALHRAEMDRGAASFWPSYKPVAALMMKRAEIGPRRFLTEYQGIPASPEGAEWPPEYFDRPGLWFEEWPSRLVLTVIAIDPSKGDSDDSGDYQAQAIVSLGRDGTLWVDCECRREPVPEMIERAVGLARQYQPHCLAVETNQGLNLLIPEFERCARAQKLLVPLQSVEHYGESKVARIRRLGTYLSRGQIRVRNTAGGRMLVDQLRDFPRGDHDDAADALEIGIRRIELLTAGK